MPQCVAFGCTNKSGKGSSVTFHRFPKKEQTCQKWTQALRREAFSPVPGVTMLCSAHFLDADFDRTGQTIRLRDGVVTSVFNFPSHLLKKPVNRKPPACRERPEDEPTEKVPPRPVIEHTYCTKDSPTKAMKRKLDVAESTMGNLRKKLKAAHQQTRRLRKTVDKLSSVVEELQNMGFVSDNCVEVLNSTSSGVSHALMSRMLKNQENGTKSRQEYDSVLKAFALTLNFYSAKAYNYVREVFDLALPSPSTLRTWYSSVDGSPGFNEQVLKALEAKFKDNPNTLCALMLDEMSLMEGVELCGDDVLGYVDLGAGQQDDGAPLARNALVFMLVAVNDSWKVPVAHFFINSMSGKEQANLVSECLMRLHAVGAKVISLTCDGPSAHITMLRELGANICAEEMRASFPHPADPEKSVCVLLDACHMLKLARNSLATLRTIRDEGGREISWRYITALHDLQKEEGLRLGNKLSRKHVEWRSNIMEVDTAAQTLSSSVADAIEFCRDTLMLPQFRGSEATCNYIRIIDRLFDTLNSRNPLARNYKAPLHPAGEHTFVSFLHHARTYLAGLTDGAGQRMVRGRQKTAFVGFLTCIDAILQLYQEYVKPPTAPLKYLLTYKMSQNHLELFFGAVRLSCGSNNNPTVRQFVAAYKRLLMKHHIKAGSGSCSAKDDTCILAATTNNMKKKEGQDMLIARRYGLHRQPQQEDHDYADVAPQGLNLSMYVESSVTYISGYVVKMVKRTFKCETCATALTEADNVSLPGYGLIRAKTRGGLVVPSHSVVKVCQATERCVRRVLAMTGNRMPHGTGLKSAIETSVLSELGSSVFESLSEHMLDVEAESNHVFSLIRGVVAAYLKIRLHHVVKSQNSDMKDERVRKKFHKLILFAHQ